MSLFPVYGNDSRVLIGKEQYCYDHNNIIGCPKAIPDFGVVRVTVSLVDEVITVTFLHVNKVHTFIFFAIIDELHVRTLSHLHTG